jgi:hypothetical protein
MWKALTALVAAVVLAGCAGPRDLSNDVSTFSQWPADLKPASYAFERLPSQQAHPEQQQRLEDAARASIEAAGFAPAGDPKTADFTIQIGARVSANELSPFDDPFWWHGGLYYGRHFRHSYWGPSWGMSYTAQSYQREVALLIRDRKSGQPLFEARATNDGLSSEIDTLLGAMFEAAMKDFPHNGINPRRVVTRINPEG